MATDEQKSKWKLWPSVLATCFILITVSQLLISYFLYRYIVEVDERCSVKTRFKRASIEDNAINPISDAAVEFFDPKIHPELAKPTNGQNGDNSYVWLSAYSRMPVEAMQTFCKGTSEYCPPSPQGPEGPPGPPGLRGIQGLVGLKGERGDVGPRGDKGERGPQGMQGIKGSKGDRGCKGTTGHDGRDGIPGEPGFDGIPGLHGQDGTPGSNGIPGLKGDPGIPGTNGTKGAKGERGRKGQAGLLGERGLTGPKGEKGESGQAGSNGTPGINTWIYENDTKNGAMRPLHAPTITGVQRPMHYTLMEKENLRIKCSSIGHPEPQVQWIRVDTVPITLGKWNYGSLDGAVLNLTHIRRDQMGLYMCVANNGIPPIANMTYKIDVVFPPQIHALRSNRHAGAFNGSYLTLECYVESFPEAVFYWEGPNKQVLHNGSKYHIHNDPKGRYNTTMRLNITNINFPGEDGEYRCYAKNELGKEYVNFTVYERTTSFYIPPDSESGALDTYGQKPPDRVDLDDLCPAPPPCPQCDEAKCIDGSLSLFQMIPDFKVHTLNEGSRYGMPPRRLDCQLYAIGKPVYYGSKENSLYGSWMIDPVPPKSQGDFVWATYENERKILYEYKNTTFFSQKKQPNIYELEHEFQGNSHVVYNGTFYYHQRDGHSTIIRMYNITNKEEVKIALNVEDIVKDGANYTLYNSSKNYIDFSADDNGIWAIFRLPNNDTAVMKLNAETLEVQYAWNISVNSDFFGEMFIVCGVLYAVDKVTTINTKIRFALDLYRNRLIEMGLKFVNPFAKTTMITYNHRLKELITWDNGNQLAYPVRYNELNIPQPRVRMMKKKGIR